MKREREQDLKPSKEYARLSTGKMLRLTREFAGLTQSQLAKASCIPQPAISALENDREELGRERAQRLARVMNVHPGSLMFPGWRVHSRAKRAA